MLKRLAMLMALVSASSAAWADARSACENWKYTPPDRSIATCSEVIRRDARAAWAYNNRGNAYHAKGDYDRAIADYNRGDRHRSEVRRGLQQPRHRLPAPRATTTAPSPTTTRPSTSIRSTPLAYNNRGIAYYAKGDYDRAIADYNEAIDLDPKYALAYNNRGNAYDAKGDYDRAIADYNKAIRLDPKYAMAYNNRGNAYYAKKRLRPRHRRLQQRPSTRSEVRVGLQQPRQRLRRAKGDHDRAIADYDEAIRLDPKLRHRLQQPRHRLPRQGRLRPRHRRLQRGDQTRSEVRQGLQQPRQRLRKPRATTTAPSPTTTEAIDSIRSTPWPTTTAASPTATRATTTAPSPTTTRPSSSIRSTRWPTTTAATPTDAKGDHDRAIADYNKAIEIDPKFDEAHRNRGNANTDKAPIEKRFRGSGFFVSHDGLVLTNAHVVENCRQTTVRSPDNVGQGSILARDTQNDLALLASGLKPIRVATLRTSAKLGEEVVVFGYPLSGLLASSGNVTTGIVSALAGLRDDSRLLQISAPIQPGNSGGPVLDRRGDVIGVVVSRFTMTSKDAVQNVSFAIKNTGAISFLDAQAVAYSKAVEGAPPLPTEDLAERAKAFTVQIECSRLDGTSGSVATPILAVPPRLLTRCDGIEVLVGSERQCLKPKDAFKDCAECPEMVVIPAGEFMMGSNDGGSDEKPVHKVAIGRPFAVGKFEVTFAEWDACVAAGGCSHKPEDRGWGRGRQPVINVSWDDATKEYLPWLSRKTGKTYRLLTEAEWEYAARGGCDHDLFLGQRHRQEPGELQWLRQPVGQ